MVPPPESCACVAAWDGELGKARRGHHQAPTLGGARLHAGGETIALRAGDGESGA